MIINPIWWKYADFYPYDDEPGYDGKHNGGLKGLKKDAPKEAVEEFEKYKRKNAWFLPCINYKKGLKVF